MRIVEAVSTTGANGAVHYARRIIPELVARGHEVILAALPGSWIAGELAGQVEVYETRFARWPLRHLREFARFCEQHGVDVVHSHLTRANNFAALLHALHGVRNLSHSHDTNPQLHYFFHDRVVAVSNDTLRLHRRYGAARGGRGEVLLNFVDTRVFRPRFPGGGADPLRDLIHVAPDTPVILQVGEIGGRKGHDVTLAALPAVWQRFPEARMVFMGAGDPLPTTDRRIHWLGRRSDLPRLLPWATVSVLPSLRDPCPLAALESIACGVPVVGSDVGGIPEILGDTAGILVPARDPGRLAEGVNALLAAPARREQLAAAGLRRVEERFAIQPHMDRLERILQDVAGLRR